MTDQRQQHTWQDNNEPPFACTSDMRAPLLLTTLVVLVTLTWVLWPSPNQKTRGTKHEQQPANANQQRERNVSKQRLVMPMPIMDRASSLLLRPLQLRGLRLRNRLIRAAAYGGSSLEAMCATHVEVARGGVGMTTVEYMSVSLDGRTFPSQLVLTELSESEASGLRRLCSEVKAHGASVSAQLVHAGGFANRAVIHCRPGAPSSVFSPSNMCWTRELSEEDLDRLEEAYVSSAQVAKELGFDAVELHCGHGYLLSQFLSPSRNRRTDRWGGDSAGGRFSYPLRILRSIRRGVGDDFPIAVKFNVDDGFDSGLTLNDACVFARVCEEAGADLLVPSCGYVDRNGFHMLRGDVPLLKMIRAIPGFVEKLALALIGKWLVPSVEFEKQFLRRQAVEVLNAVEKIPVALLGGVRTWSGMEDALASGFSAIQTARTLIREPNFVRRIEASLSCAEPRDVHSRCTNCNACVVSALAEGVAMRCPLRRHDEVVGDIEDIKFLKS